jgi:magnesium-transporting ATPase (P-type)
MALIDPHALSADTCLKTLDAGSEGLISAEVARRLAEHGPNKLPAARTRGPLHRFLSQLPRSSL